MDDLNMVLQSFVLASVSFETINFVECYRNKGDCSKCKCFFCFGKRAWWIRNH